MSEVSTPPPSISDADLIALYQESEQAKNGPCERRKTILTQLGNLFLAAIAEAKTAKSLARLVALRDLIDPKSRAHICTTKFRINLNEAIASLEGLVGYVVEGETGYFLCPDYFWCKIPIAGAWVHPKSSITEIEREFLALKKEPPQCVYEAFRDGEKTELFTDAVIPFAVAVENFNTSMQLAT